MEGNFGAQNLSDKRAYLNEFDHTNKQEEIKTVKDHGKIIKEEDVNIGVIL